MWPSRRACGFALVLAASACGAVRREPQLPRAARSGDAKQRSGTAEPPPVAPARAFPPTARGDVSFEAWEPDGTRRLIAQGVRVLERPGGALELADQLLPSQRMLSPVELPARLGGGYVFAVNAGSDALLWRAASWTAPLEPLAHFDAEVERLVPGFDRLYVQRGRGAPWLAVDVENGHALDLGSLPAAPTYGPMLFRDEWFAVVNVPLRGVLATFDAGGTWHPLGLPAADLTRADGGVRLDADGRRLLLGQGGTLASWTEPPPRATDEELRRRPRPPAPLGPRPLEAAVLHGAPAGDGTALVATRGALARVRLADGAIMEFSPDAYGGQAPCDAVPLGNGTGFVCGEPHGPTTVYALGRGFVLAPVLRFDDPRRVAPNGRGALVIDGSCAPALRVANVRCIVPATGAPFEVPVASPNERAVALADGGVALIAPENPKPGDEPSEKSKRRVRKPASAKADKTAEAPLGRLTLLHPGKAPQTLVLRLESSDDETAPALVKSGLWLDSFQQAPSGELRGWVAGGSALVGVRVTLDGHVRTGLPEPHLDRALVSGRFALVVGRARSVRETIDGGFEWTDGELPAEPDLRPDKSFGAEHGCTALGCAVAGWVRVGWTMGNTVRSSLAPTPEPTRLLGSGANRWSLDCRPTGEQSRPPLRQNPEPDDRTLSPWNPLAEVAPPRHAPRDAAFDVANEAALALFHAYAWGPNGDGWARDARFLVRIRDPYQVSDAIWSSAPSTSPWSSAGLAGDTFGRSPSGPPATWRLLTDPVKHVALLLVSAKGTVDHFLVQEGRPVTKLKTKGPVGVVTSVAWSGGRLYVSALGEARSLRLFRLEAGTLELLGEFPDLGTRGDAPALAPATRGDGVGVWVHEADYFLYPFVEATRRFDPPIVTRARDLAVMPPSCSSAEDGYAVGDALSLEPNIDLQNTPDGATTGNGIEVRLVVGPNHVCTDGLSAPLGGRSRDPYHPRGSSPSAARPKPDTAAKSANSSPQPDGGTPPHAAPARDDNAGAELVLAAPDGSRRGFHCRD